jgi:hypothetical protein
MEVKAQMALALKDKQLVVSQQAMDELMGTPGGKKGNIHYAGLIEAAAIQALLAQVEVVPNNPSARVLGLEPSKKLEMPDRIIFGTADQMNEVILTADLRFTTAASAQGVHLKHRGFNALSFMGL